MLFFIVCFIKTLLGDDAREDLLADTDLHLGSKLGISLVDHCHTDAAVSGNRTVAGGNHTDLNSLYLNRIACTRYRLVLKLDAYDLPRKTCLLLGSKCIAADEVLVLDLCEHAETCLERSDFIAEFMSVKRKSCLKAEGITTSKAAWGHAGSEKDVPYLIDRLVRALDLESVLSGIAGTAYYHPRTLPFSLIICIESKLCRRSKPESLYCKLLGLRALESDFSP